MIYKIASHYLPAIFYGDITGIDTSIDYNKKFLKDLDEGKYSDVEDCTCINNFTWGEGSGWEFDDVSGLIADNVYTYMSGKDLENWYEHEFVNEVSDYIIHRMCNKKFDASNLTPEKIKRFLSSIYWNGFFPSDKLKKETCDRVIEYFSR